MFLTKREKRERRRADNRVLRAGIEMGTVRTSPNKGALLPVLNEALR